MVICRFAASDEGRTDRSGVADAAAGEDVAHLITAFQSVGSLMAFLYDYGDEWRFRVEVVETGQAQPGADYPRIVSKFGKAPPQYPDIRDQ